MLQQILFNLTIIEQVYHYCNFNIIKMRASQYRQFCWRIILLEETSTVASWVHGSKKGVSFIRWLFCSVDFPDFNSAKKEEHQWLNQFDVRVDNAKSLAQYHVDKNGCVPSKGTNSVLPLLRGKASTSDTQCHTMRLNKREVAALNPGQTPVDVSACPVYALTKYRFPGEFSNYFLMFGS